MADPTLGGSAVLGKVQSFSGDKVTNIAVLPFPTKDSDATELYDMLGVTRQFTLTGVFSGTTAVVAAAIAAIETLADGDQTAGLTLSMDEMAADATVFVLSFNYNWDVTGVSNRATYNLVLVEGTAI